MRHLLSSVFTCLSRHFTSLLNFSILSALPGSVGGSCCVTLYLVEVLFPNPVPRLHLLFWQAGLFGLFPEPAQLLVLKHDVLQLLTGLSEVIGACSRGAREAVRVHVYADALSKRTDDGAEVLVL